MLPREGLILVLAGVLSGVIGALALTRLLSSSLYAATASDPMIYACASVVLTGMSLIACYWPARRALQADPIVTLRQE